MRIFKKEKWYEGWFDYDNVVRNDGFEYDEDRGIVEYIKDA